MHPNNADGMAKQLNVDPYQTSPLVAVFQVFITAPLGAVWKGAIWSGSTLFAQICPSEY